MSDRTQKYLYEILYLDSRDSHSRIMQVVAEDTTDALRQAYEDDYYFGELISIDELYEVNDEGS